MAKAILRKGAEVTDAPPDAGPGSGREFREAITRLVTDAPERATLLPTLAATWLDTPIGPMLAIAGENDLHLLEFAERIALPREIERLRAKAGPIAFRASPMLARVEAALAAYFGGMPFPADLPLKGLGSAFEREVWGELGRIPAGQTRSYGEVAQRLGQPAAVRAVARANGANPIALLVPCHRVIGADGALTGYGGKLWRKTWLLKHEREMAARETVAKP
ncbi:methylated-DNA--[protein]-cysteine S-methyltransferase [Aureimonas sp. AU20]|uniref:methylated-DNA--[protein]-cysteine S-methyltransferase n=1 Tax=Aureimonas sp. AU20 TaxID=1349819 RepID=UPI00071F0E7E|nr:methylated-DNA--[protein]-cysteine S-methyltransferase [Aureimonas sp. AU20]ALN71324.1 hypothetical protein M673_01275 [Aureimonas sp. AU20]